MSSITSYFSLDHRAQTLVQPSGIRLSCLYYLPQAERKKKKKDKKRKWILYTPSRWRPGPTHVLNDVTKMRGNLFLFRNVAVSYGLSTGNGGSIHTNMGKHVHHSVSDLITERGTCAPRQAKASKEPIDSKKHILSSGSVHYNMS